MRPGQGSQHPMARKDRACLEAGLGITATLLHFELTEQGQTAQSHITACLTLLKLSFLFQGLCRLYFTLPKKERA